MQVLDATVNITKRDFCANSKAIQKYATKYL